MALESATSDVISGPSSAQSPFTAPQINLPKGGGALRGIDDKFSANPVTGTGSLSVPIVTSPGRSGAALQLGVAYDSGAGNGPFGLGWSLHLSSISRRTDKGLPLYDDTAPDVRARESDIFMLAGSEDLVRVLVREGSDWVDEDQPPRDGYQIKAYRPRTEGLFSRIERWRHLAEGTTHWRTISRDNVLTLYGLDAGSRIADPENPLRVFSWLISRSYDDKGNAVIYDYVGEDDRGVYLDRPSEQHRSRTANRYIKRIRYGNREPLLLDPQTPSFRSADVHARDPDAVNWMFSVVFDYGEGHYHEESTEDGRLLATAHYEPQSAWPARLDPFSTFRSRFEIRTYRLCRRVLMFHHFPDELGTSNCLVKSTAFTYRERRFGSFLERVIQSGHALQPDGRYLTRSLPPLDLAYTGSPLDQPELGDFIPQDVDESSLDNLPGGVDGGTYRWLDLDGEGIAGVLAEQDGAWLYKPNLGNGRFGAMETVRTQPAAAGHRNRRQHLMDVAGDGNLDLVLLSPESPGFYGRTRKADWEGFRAFRSMPVLDWNDPNLRFVDLTGDGIADVLITEDDAYTWHASLLQEGYGDGIRVRIPLEEEETGPRAIFADPTQSIYLADMTGDGLSDIVRIRYREVCYWPNRGRGCFGAKCIMDHAPWFDEPDLFDQRRIRLADTDGTGTADILYLGRDGVAIYLNEAGNSLSSARIIRKFPAVDNVASVDVADVLGRGTSCLVWSSPLPRDSSRQIRYIDLMRGRKPHLLCRIDNHMGAVAQIEYASSTEFYLADKLAGTPWVTKLPFPVHVVCRVESYDSVSRNRMVTRYSYHHGFYDGLEREFRGFPRVDQLDTEHVASLSKDGDLPRGDNWDAASSVPPVLTKTWSHTGVFIDAGSISRHLAHEYFRGHPAQPLLCDTILPEGLSPFEAREACRALKGSMLRREVYGLDGTAQEATPYTVAENNFTVVPLQPLGENRYAVFFTHAREAVNVHFERRAADPRVGHELTLEVDKYGNVLRSVTIGYARHVPAFEEQAQTLATLTANRFTCVVTEPDAYRLPLPAETKTYQLTGPELKGARLLNLHAVEAMCAAAVEIPYEANPTAGHMQKRLVEQSRTLYRKNDLSGILPEGELESLGLPGESYRLAFTRGLLDLFKAKASLPELNTILGSASAGYRDVNGLGPYWTTAGSIFYSPGPDDTPYRELEFALRHFFLPHRYEDPFGHRTIVKYDAPHDLAPVQTLDAVGNETRGELDYRVLQLRRVVDPNGNRQEARFDALGLLAGTALLGKPTGVVEGDSFDRFVIDLPPAEITRYFNALQPRELAIEHLGTATTRILYDFDRVPACAASVARETHVSALEHGEQTRVQLRFAYSDGFGREAQTKSQAEAGPLDPNVKDSRAANPRWVGTGAKIYNNKGNPVRQYEPFFSATPHFGIEAWGVSSVLFYDPVERVVATLHPNHTFEKVVFDAWCQRSYDVNDTVTFAPKADPDVGDYFRRLPDEAYLPTWYCRRIGGELGPHERAAAEKAARHANTPTTAHFDSLGRAFVSIADNGRGADGQEQLYHTRTIFDIEGNRRAVIDARHRLVMRYDYDLLRTCIRQHSMEAGERWMLNDAVGKPLRAWNSRGYAYRMDYDRLHRPLASYVRGGIPGEAGGQFFAEEIVFQKTVYGDNPETGMTAAEQRGRNLRGKPYRQFDDSGVVVSGHYDFKGNPLTTSRQFARDYKRIPDWLRHVALQPEIFASANAYDALNRVIDMTAPDGSRYRPTYNDASLLYAVDVNIRGARAQGRRVWSSFVRYINYDAKGQRTVIRYGNGSTTAYRYDPTTYRLAHLKTSRHTCSSADTAQIFKHAEKVQDLRYVYDPVGNITRIDDGALRTVFHANHRVDPAADYTCDPLYRLVCATGREHIDQSALNFAPQGGNYRDFPLVGASNLHDPQALRNYEERYDYDPVGNCRTLRHETASGSWTRAYAYLEPSLLESDETSNRLSTTSLADGPATLVERYQYDAHGNTTQMPHLPKMEWDFHDQLRGTSRQVVNAGTREMTYYVYDAAGKRTRKITERQNGQLKNERYYIDGFEIYREFAGENVVELERQSLSVMDDKSRIALIETLTIDRREPVDSPLSVQRFQLANHLGSACLELDQSAGLLSYEEYSPYGNSTFQVNRGAAEVSLKRYRYTGMERDEESGFAYHGARYYASWLGRWASCDPLGLADGVNLYQYSNSNPIRNKDSSGTMSSETEVVQDSSDLTGQTFVSPNGDTTYVPNDPYGTEVINFAEPLEILVPEPKKKVAPKPKPKPKPKPEPKPPVAAPPPAPPAGSPAAPGPGSGGASAGEAAGAFAEGAAKGLATGIAVDIGIGFVAGLTGVAAGTLGLALGAVLLPVAIYGVATHWDQVKATASRLVSNTGTAQDYEAAGEVFGGLLSMGASGAASEAGEEVGQVVRSAGKDALESIRPSVRPSVGTDDVPPGSVGAMRRYRYEGSPKHGAEQRGRIGATPSNGQEALDNSVSLKDMGGRRVGIDYETGEYVVFDETHPGQGIFHGHVRAWDELTSQMQNALRKADLVDRRGRILRGP